MIPIRSPLRRAPELRRRVSVILALAEDRIVRDHVRGAIGFLEETGKDLSFDRALSIYFRTVGVPRRIQRAVSVGALTEASRLWTPERLENGPAREDVGVVRAVARRLRGRKHGSLRAGVEEASSRALDQVKEAYVSGAIDMVRALQGIVAPAEAVQFYLDSLEIDPGWAERIFHEALVEAADARTKGEGAEQADGRPRETDAEEETEDEA